MADVSGITSVRPTENTIVEAVTYGDAIGIGQGVYYDTTDKEYKLADASALATAKTRGIAMTSGVDGGMGIIAKGGDVLLEGATIPVGVYVQSATAGGIAPEADLTTNDYLTVLGQCVNATTKQFTIAITISGAQHA